MSGYGKRDLLAMAEALGFTYEGLDGSGHMRFLHSNGKVTSLPSTPSEYRGMRNCQLLLERVAGRKLPRVNKRRSHKAFKPSGFSIDVAHADQQRWHGVHGADVEALWKERDALVARCRDLAQHRHRLRGIPPLLNRIAAIEQRLVDLHQPVEHFDPYSLAEGATHA